MASLKIKEPLSQMVGLTKGSENGMEIHGGGAEEGVGSGGVGWMAGKLDRYCLSRAPTVYTYKTLHCPCTVHTRTWTKRSIHQPSKHNQHNNVSHHITSTIRSSVTHLNHLNVQSFYISLPIH